MDKGPHIIPLVPGGVPVIIHASQYEHYQNKYDITGGNDVDRKYLDVEFKLLTSDHQYYDFLPATSDGKGASDSQRPADLFYVRPDGEAGQIALNLERNVYITGHGSTTIRSYSNPYSLFLKDLPEELTAVAGDVVCEIVVYRGGNLDNRRESSANFIIRVEPKPSAIGMPSYNANIKPASDQQYASDEERNEQTSIYYTGDPVDNSLITWAEVVEEANTGDLRELLTPGQEIRAEMLTTGQYMGIRCIHVEDFRTAYFESKHLFKAPKKIKNSPNSSIMLDGILAARQFASPSAMFDGYYAPEIIPYLIKSKCRYFINASVINTHGQAGVNVYQRSLPNYTEGDGSIPGTVFDYYKTKAGRIHTDGSGTPRPWVLRDRDAVARTSTGPWGNMIIEGLDLYGDFGISADGEIFKYDENTEDFYIPIIWRLQGEDHTDPSTLPVDIQSWADVKKAATKGKLLNSNLELGQLMPELQTVGVLRCVHITANYAVFDSETVKGECLPQSALGTLLSSVNNVMTEDEKEIFTVLGKSGNVDVYTQAASRTNLHVTGGSGVYSYTNSVLGNLLFDYYADAYLGENTSEPKRVKSGTYWAYYGTTYKTFINTNGGAQTYSVSSYTSMKHSLNPVFVVGTIS